MLTIEAERCVMMLYLRLSMALAPSRVSESMQLQNMEYLGFPKSKESYNGDVDSATWGCHNGKPEDLQLLSLSRFKKYCLRTDWGKEKSSEIVQNSCQEFYGR